MGTMVRTSSEQAQIQQLLARLATTEGQKLYTRTPGLCLPHLRAAIEMAPDPVAQFLLREQVQRSEEISEDLRSYTLKRDALRRGLLNKQEENAWRRALVQLVGERNVRVV
ncbi:MAG: hypothetical protein A2Z04_06490 [Chloroflexi bacterium RBG_16_57_9]|nr:MAG: hypothetical protein A2Z04_06490 [Chloroflexi bacterium RBG_16_57_9]